MGSILFIYTVSKMLLTMWVDTKKEGRKMPSTTLERVIGAFREVLEESPKSSITIVADTLLLEGLGLNVLSFRHDWLDDYDQDLLEIVCDLEHEFQIGLGDGDIVPWTTIQSVADSIDQILAEEGART